jgi:hypothetical protein
MTSFEPPCDPLLLTAIAYANKNHFDIANIVYTMFKDEFVCSNIKQSKWYVKDTQGDGWVEDENARCLRIKMSTDVVKMFCAVSAFHAQKACFTEDETERERCSNISKRVLLLGSALKDHGFKNAIIKECCDLFFIKGFPQST